MAKKLRNTRIAGRGRRAGFTLLETLVAAAIASMVMGGVVALMYITARTLKELYGPMASRSERMNALNQIRFRLCEAGVSTCAVTDDNHRIRFRDPNFDGKTSELYFEPDSQTLFYDEDIDASPGRRRVARGPINITAADSTRPSFSTVIQRTSGPKTSDRDEKNTGSNRSS